MQEPTSQTSSHSESFLGSSRKALAVFAVFVAAISVFIGQLNLEFVESYLYDLRVKAKPLHSNSEAIELITITPETVEFNKGFPSAVAQSQVLEKILAQQPLAVIYDFPFDEVSGSEIEKNLWEAQFVANKKVYVAGRSTPLIGEEDELFLKDPLEQVSVVPAPKTSDLVNFAKDGVTRRMILTFQNRPLLPLIVARKLNPELENINNIKGIFKFYDTDQAYINFKKTGSFPSVGFEELQINSASVPSLKDKIVILGTDLKFSNGEYIQTPFSRDATAMTRSEMLANIIDTLILNNGAIRAPKYVNWVLIFFAAILATYAVMSMTPVKGLSFLGAAILILIVVSTLSYWSLGLWLPLAGPIITVLLCYYLLLPYRLIIENRRSWEYFQKNKLLKQVEELKSNFISMMSHDLKTPIARIQGMTDVILADNVTLSHQQRDAVDTIKHSSDDLLKFINAILSYGKIESEGVQLNLVSKDVNALLTDVIKKHEFLAKVKHIQIICELEPLFPIQVDSDLMRQIFSNLIENAIKYSPEDTKILVSSEESNNKIVIQVADQGPGIPADELQSIFMKFFRSKNVKSSSVKGSGLGLYLAKYFTELHHGRIFVESSHGNGSTFTVELPFEQGDFHA